MAIALPAALADALERIVGSVVSARAVIGRGYTPARRFVVTGSDGKTWFVKWASDSGTASALTQERHAYQALHSAPFVPAYFGHGEAPATRGIGYPFLVLEDLTGCRWPPPWTAASIAAVQAALAGVSATRGAWVDGLPRIEERKPVVNFWEEVASDPAPFLSLRLCSPSWLQTALPVLLRASASPPLSGDALLHNDVRSDNLCSLRPDGSACLIDWDKACRGNALFDVAMWLPSLCAEGGPLPEAVSSEAAIFAPYLAGYFAVRTPLQEDPRLFALLRPMLQVALPWAARSLGLPPP